MLTMMESWKWLWQERIIRVRKMIYATLCMLLLLTWNPSQAQQDSTPSMARPMFQDVTEEMFRSSPESNPVQLNYGVAVSDVDNDGKLEVVVAGYNGPNLILKYDQVNGNLVNIADDDPSSPYYALRDEGGNAIGVSACDIDGDGREEIYFLNTNQAYSGMASYSDKLFKFREGKYVDILSDSINRNIASYFAGRSVACVDRNGNGRYAVYLANYAKGNVGPHSLIEMDESRSDISRGIIALRNVAEEAGVAKLTGGRGVTVGPILSKDGRSDIFCDNENGPNFLFKNNGDGTFDDIASQTGVADGRQHGRGVMLTDFNGDGDIDIVYGNWNGPHRIFLQTVDSQGQPKFKNIATDAFAKPSPIRTVIAADFNNDGNLEILLNNIAYRGHAPNRLFQVVPGSLGEDPTITELDIGDALEPTGRGTGGAVTDLDGDGILEVILSHGESAEQPLSIYKLHPNEDSAHGWIRVHVLTAQGAPARGAKVTLHSNTRRQTRVIDAGSGYLCQMEPVAHFGLADDLPVKLEVLWPDTSFKSLDLNSSVVDSEITISHPQPASERITNARSESQSFGLAHDLYNEHNRPHKAVNHPASASTLDYQRGSVKHSDVSLNHQRGRARYSHNPLVSHNGSTHHSRSHQTGVTSPFDRRIEAVRHRENPLDHQKGREGYLENRVVPQRETTIRPETPLISKIDSDYIIYLTKLVMDFITERDQDAARSQRNLSLLQQVFIEYQRASKGGLQYVQNAN